MKRSPRDERPNEWHTFDRTIAEVRARFSDIPTDVSEALIDEAVVVARKGSVPRQTVTLDALQSDE
jgi:hypothetical protein